MQCLNRRLGNITHDSELRAQVTAWQQQGTLDEATIDERDAHKGRLRLFTKKGQEYGLVLTRGTALATGDVFVQETGEGAVLISLAPQELLVLTLRPELSPEERLRWAVRIGHVLGNQHWPVMMRGEQICTPVNINRAVMETVLKTHHVTNYCTIRYEQHAWLAEKDHLTWTAPHS